TGQDPRHRDALPQGRPTLQDPRAELDLLRRKHAVDLRDDGGAFADGCRHPLGRARAHIADGEHAWPACLERPSLSPRRPGAVDELSASDHEALVVDLNAILEPAGIGIGADEQEEVAERAGVRLSGPAAA